MIEAPGLRERTRRAVAAELTAAALELFAEQGFEATTVDQIATAVGLSRRSFFRYFATKEDVLLQSMAASGERVAAELAARPDDEPAWTALRRCFDGLVEGICADPAQSSVLLEMLLASPALRAGHLAKQAAWQALLADVLVRRTSHTPSGNADELAASALAGAAVACLEAAQVAWVRSRSPDSPTPATELDTLLDSAMNTVHPLDTH